MPELVPKGRRMESRAGMSDRAKAGASWARRASSDANAPAEYGGGGVDFIYDAIVMEELARVRAHGLMMGLHSDICLPYLDELRQRGSEAALSAPGAISGDVPSWRIAMTEPGTGSDLAAVQTTARRDGDSYVINGSKIFISNGQIADLVIVVCKDRPQGQPAPSSGVSLILVEASAPGFVRGRKLDKLGFRGQDTSELFFEDCRVPAGNLLGTEGAGFKMLMEKLQQERLVTAVGAMAPARGAASRTPSPTPASASVRPADRLVPEHPVQARRDDDRSRGRPSLRRPAAAAHVRGEEIVTEVSMAKWWVTELLKRVSSQCLQLHGGYGFMMEFPVSTDYADAAVQSIYAGTNEIMKVIIARRMGLETRK
jgi:acyl-CoA dehydrogenase